jgi:hypothetical protein
MTPHRHHCLGALATELARFCSPILPGRAEFVLQEWNRRKLQHLQSAAYANAARRRAGLCERYCTPPIPMSQSFMRSSLQCDASSRDGRRQLTKQHVAMCAVSVPWYEPVCARQLFTGDAAVGDPGTLESHAYHVLATTGVSASEHARNTHVTT